MKRNETLGVLRFGLDNVPLELQDPYPFLRVILAEKGTHFGGYFKYRPIFHTFQMLACQKFWKFGKNGPMFSGILVENGNPCLGISCEKVNH